MSLDLNQLQEAHNAHPRAVGKALPRKKHQLKDQKESTRQLESRVRNHRSPTDLLKTSSQLRVLMFLASLYGESQNKETGIIDKKTIARHCNVTPQTARCAIRRLQEKEMVAVLSTSYSSTEGGCSFLLTEYGLEIANTLKDNLRIENKNSGLQATDYFADKPPYLKSLTHIEPQINAKLINDTMQRNLDDLVHQLKLEATFQVVTDDLLAIFMAVKTPCDVFLESIEHLDALFHQSNEVETDEPKFWFLKNLCAGYVAPPPNFLSRKVRDVASRTRVKREELSQLRRLFVELFDTEHEIWKLKQGRQSLERILSDLSPSKYTPLHSPEGQEELRKYFARRTGREDLLCDP